MGKGIKTNVEYVSANPTGPLHVGHCRGAVFGDALAALLRETGYDVSTEYYINDAGAQVDTVARSAFLRYQEALGTDIGEIPAGLYPGKYLIPVGQALAPEHEKKSPSHEGRSNGFPIAPHQKRSPMNDGTLTPPGESSPRS